MKLLLLESPRFNPYENLAIESVLMKNCPEDTLIFYLWQNAHTVVIGKHQHAPSEVHMEKALEDKVTLARRSSGGGAVYHDLGNLNFTFIAKDPIYSIPKQMEMIASALNDLEIPAQVNGRNDIEVNGSKVSGNAFAHQGNTHLHHGTLLVNVDKTALGKYLNVNPKKLKRKNVASVSARIQNLSEFKELTIEELKHHLFDTVRRYAHTQGEWLDFEAMDASQEIRLYENQDFVLGKDIKSQIRFEECFDFGCIRWDFISEKGMITQSKLYSDALDTLWVEALEKWVVGSSEKDLINHISLYNDEQPERLKQLVFALNEAVLELA